MRHFGKGVLPVSLMHLLRSLLCMIQKKKETLHICFHSTYFFSFFRRPWWPCLNVKCQVYSWSKCLKFLYWLVCLGMRVSICFPKERCQTDIYWQYEYTMKGKSTYYLQENHNSSQCNFHSSEKNYEETPMLGLPQRASEDCLKQLSYVKNWEKDVKMVFGISLYFAY